MDDTRIMQQELSDYDWMFSLEFELDDLIKRRKDKNQEINDEDTLNIIGMYVEIIQKLDEPDVIGNFFEKFVDSLVNPTRKATHRHGDTSIRPCQMWEHFAEYFLRYVNLGLFADPYVLEVRHMGKSNDRGVDVFCRSETGKGIAVQAKRGFFFSTGKGTEIVLQLIGSLHYFHTVYTRAQEVKCVTTGIIFTSENGSDVKQAALDIIESAKHHPFFPVNIIILGVDEMKKNASAQHASYRTLMVEFIRDFFPTNE